MSEITLSSEEFKALSSDTRTNLLRLLKDRKHTLSEFSKKTGLSAPTVKQHLETLVKTGLIEQVDNGRKWKYYSLTRKGSEIIEPKESTSIFIMIAFSLIALGIVLYSFGSLDLVPNQWAADDIMKAPQFENAKKDMIAGSAMPEPDSLLVNEEIRESNKTDYNLVYLYIAAITGLSILAGYSLGKSRR